MSIHGEAVAEQIRSAMQSSNPRDIVTGVKEAVAEEVVSLSPDAKIVVTDYFNHSYMPDFILEWNEAGKLDKRPIFIRNTLRLGVVEEAVQGLAHRDPVVLSLAASAESGSRLDSLRERMQDASRLLITDVGSLADVAAPSDALGVARDVQGAGLPLLRLVQANLLKGGRGLLTADDAERLTRSTVPGNDDSHINEEFLVSFQESTDELFAPDAALRLQRAAELLRFGLVQEVAETPSIAGGELSDVELRVLIPYLLSDPTASAKSQLWVRIGAMMSLERLEEIGDTLSGVDVSALVVPNVEQWTARRVQLVVNNEFDESSGQDDIIEGRDDTRGVGDLDIPSWYMRNRVLTAESGPWRIFISTDARRLKGRNDSLSARWDDIVLLLAEFSLDAVDMRGVSRRIFVGAEQSGDVGADVALIRASIEDSFQVTEVRVRRRGDNDSAAGMKIDFSEMTATAERASIASLVAAARLLGHRRLPDFSVLVDVEARSRYGVDD